MNIWKSILPVMAVLFLGSTNLAIAHHGTAGFYDKETLIRIEGTVKEFRWRNPHSGLFLFVEDPSGETRVYAIEMGSPASLSKRGYSRQTFKPGDTVVAEVYPSYGSETNGEADSDKVWVNGKPAATMDPLSEDE